MTYVENLPLKMGKTIVGTARVNENGTVDLSMDAPSSLGQELLHLVRSGLVQGLSIAPICEPAKPVADNWLTPHGRFLGRRTR